MSEPVGLRWFTEHLPRLDRAVKACRDRAYWSPFQESPSRKHWGETAKTDGLAAYEALLGHAFDLDLPGVDGEVGGEVSPWTGEPLGVSYPRVDPTALLDAVQRATPRWARASPSERVGVCMEMLARLADDSFVNAHATMHTTGQPFLMAFAGSGANSLDRGLEALAMACVAMDQIPAEAQFARRFGRGPEVVLRKRYRVVPRGIALVMACGTYPAWNAWPAVFANLATGNAVVLKPHPDTILPVALGVRRLREVLAEAGHDPNLVSLAVDTWHEPVAQRFLDDARVGIVDFTGGQRFGRWLETRARQQVFTETAGCNAVVLESARDLDAALSAVAHSLCSFSGQMCTTAQNIWLPAECVRDGDEVVPVEQVIARLVAAVDRWLDAPDKARNVAGAVHSEATLQALAELTEAAGSRGKVWRHSRPLPEAGPARTASPLVAQLPAEARDLYGREHFGPVGLVMVATDRDEALRCAARDAGELGSIASYAYTTDAAFAEQVEDAFVGAGASVGINLLRQLPINYAAAYSDFHVTGLNPAGTATLTDLAFFAGRFGVVQCKVEFPDDALDEEGEGTARSR